MQTIFSTYSQNENRVTSTIIQVLKNLPVNVVERFLTMFTSSDTQSFVLFSNQVKNSDSVPDAEISANFRLLFETKVNPNSINKAQLENHYNIIKDNDGILIYLTPDDTVPPILGEFIATSGEAQKIKWINFEQLFDLISELILDQTLILSERDQFLLRNLQDFFKESGLLPVVDEVLIVAASSAWPIYLKHSLYVCQPQRSFRNTKWLGFYADGCIKPSVAKIISKHDVYEHRFSEPENSSIPTKKLLNWLHDNSDAEGVKSQIFDLSPKASDDTITLNSEIYNDLKNSNGRSYAFTQGQRYTTLEKLKNAKTTSDLV